MPVIYQQRIVPAVAGSFAISMLLATAMSVLTVQTPNARVRRGDLGGDAHEGVLEANTSVYGDAKETLLKGAVETVLFEEAQVDDIPVDDAMFCRNDERAGIKSFVPLRVTVACHRKIVWPCSIARRCYRPSITSTAYGRIIPCLASSSLLADVAQASTTTEFLRGGLSDDSAKARTASILKMNC
ncbi:hypothetical protein EV421DRAFT_1739669 [Armillaria borealis]|uniref:Uncharacterized protein n=1 Tax=Armillaria borealis TaxID=47425 RepID=A0AA39MJY3_9AGAR|nr:hypothetical protein EV421DRAFT_1739669 [Armillaria borealis]